MIISKSQSALLKKMASDKDYEIPERFTAGLLDLGYIEFRRWSEEIPNGVMTCGDYFITDKGRDFVNQCDKEDE